MTMVSSFEERSWRDTPASSPPPVNSSKEEKKAVSAATYQPGPPDLPPLLPKRAAFHRDRMHPSTM